MSTWVVRVFFQERGTKKESYSEVRFNTRDEAVAAMQKLENEYPSVGSDNFLAIESARGGRVSFLKQDYRRMHLYEDPGPVGFVV